MWITYVGGKYRRGLLEKSLNFLHVTNMLILHILIPKNFMQVSLTSARTCSYVGE